MENTVKIQFAGLGGAVVILFELTDQIKSINSLVTLPLYDYICDEMRNAINARAAAVVRPFCVEAGPVCLSAELNYRKKGVS